MLNGRLRDIAVSSDGLSIYLVNNGGTPADKITVYTYNNSTSTSDNSPIANIKLFPNPATDKLRIKGLETYPNNKNVTVFNLLGQVIQLDFIQDQYIDISSLENGIYFLNLIIDNKTYTAKFVKITH